MIHEFNIEVMAEALYRHGCQEIGANPKEWSKVRDSVQRDLKSMANNVIAHYCSIYNKIEKTIREEMCPITVNGVSMHIHPPRLIDYANVVRLAGFSPDRILSVTYRWKDETGEQSPKSGILSPGNKLLLVKPGMIFNVADTSNS